jgi:hypothetical protein
MGRREERQLRETERFGMSVDDKLEKLLDIMIEEARLKVGQEIVLAAAAAVPFAGGAITSIVSGVLHRRAIERAVEMFKAMTERLKELEEDKMDRSFFESEEFETLVALALQQLQTTHDKTKLEMLAQGLANSGTYQYSSSDRKELYTRILRDLSPNHVTVLRRLLPSGPKYGGQQHRPVVNEPSGDDLAVLQTLVANGLVKEFLKPETKLSGPRFGRQWDISEAERAINEALSKPPSRHFEISDFGLDFLSYFGLRR